MKKNEFRAQVREVLQVEVEGLAAQEKLAIVRKLAVEAETVSEFDNSNRGQSWSDEELRVIFRTAPTRENCIALAKAFKRGYGAIQQIYQWGSMSKVDIEKIQGNNAFHKQIKRIASEVGWIPGA